MNNWAIGECTDIDCVSPEKINLFASIFNDFYHFAGANRYHTYIRIGHQVVVRMLKVISANALIYTVSEYTHFWIELQFILSQANRIVFVESASELVVVDCVMFTNKRER